RSSRSTTATSGTYDACGGDARVAPSFTGVAPPDGQCDPAFEKEVRPMNVRPLGDRVLVKPVEREERTKSGIVLPDTAKEKPQEGIVEAVGTGRILDNGTKIPLELKIGDRVRYAKYAGNEFKLEEDEYLIIS